jgi:hypothetical protein
MIGDIRKLLQAEPFEPFYIVTSAEKRYFVASHDHAGFSPGGSRVIVWFDDESSVTVPGLHIAGIEQGAAASSPAT